MCLFRRGDADFRQGNSCQPHFNDGSGEVTHADAPYSRLLIQDETT